MGIGPCHRSVSGLRAGVKSEILAFDPPLCRRLRVKSSGQFNPGDRIYRASCWINRGYGKLALFGHFLPSIALHAELVRAYDSSLWAPWLFLGAGGPWAGDSYPVERSVGFCRDGVLGTRHNSLILS